MLTVNQALTQLTGDPKAFLRENLLQVADFVGASGIKQAVFQTSLLALNAQLTTAKRYGRVLGSYRTHGIQEFLFAENARINHQTTNVTVQFVQMYQYENVATIQWHSLAAAGANVPDLMITTKLTGCSFLVRTTPAGEIQCAHVQPAQNQSGQELRQVLSENHAGAYERLYGRFAKSNEKGYVDGEASTVIGVRRNGAWKIYAQRLVHQQNMMKVVQRIYPA